jgi:hypothetical protein
MALPLPKTPLPIAFTDFRPVTLTSLFGRLCERLIEVRLDAWSKIDPRQHGFCPGSSPEVLLLRLVRDITEALRVRHRGGTANCKQDSRPYRQSCCLVVAIDQTDAFCSVSPDEMLRAFQALGVPPHLLRWIRAFLSDRSLRVLWRGRLSSVVAVLWGFLQGTVSGPKNWNVFADSLSRILTPGLAQVLAGRPGIHAEYGWIADDLIIWISGGDPGALISPLNLLCARVARWSEEKGLTLSAKKTRACFFGSAPPAGRCVSVGPLQVPIADTITILGVTLDSKMSMGAHVASLLLPQPAMLEKLKLACSWLAPSKGAQLVSAVVASRFLFAAPVWWPLARVDDREALESSFRAACRVASGAIGTAPNSAVLAELHLFPLALGVLKASYRLAAKMLRSHWPLQLAPAIRTTGQPRAVEIARDSFFSLAADIRRIPREPALEPLVGDLANARNVTFCAVPPPLSRVWSSAEKAAWNSSLVASCGASIVVVCDGSVSGESSGAAAVAFRDSVRVDSVRVPAGNMACSFSAEARGFFAGIGLLSSLLAPGESGVIVSDGLSVLSALGRGPLRQRLGFGTRIWSSLLATASNHVISCGFVFGHCSWPLGDIADRAAKAASSRVITPAFAWDEARVLFAPALAEHETLSRGTMGFRAKLVANKPLFLPWTRGLGRGGERLLIQLRTGCCGLLGGWRHEAPEDCILCGGIAVLSRSGGAIEHLFACPQLSDLVRLFRLPTGTTSLVLAPKKAVLFARAALARFDLHRPEV